MSLVGRKGIGLLDDDVGGCGWVCRGGRIVHANDDARGRLGHDLIIRAQADE